MNYDANLPTRYDSPRSILADRLTDLARTLSGAVSMLADSAPADVEEPVGELVAYLGAARATIDEIQKGLAEPNPKRTVTKRFTATEVERAASVNSAAAALRADVNRTKSVPLPDPVPVHPWLALVGAFTRAHG